MNNKSLKSPRQRMVNLMYLVFIAMLAMHIPSETPDGFEWLDKHRERDSCNLDNRNDKLRLESHSFVDIYGEKMKWLPDTEEVNELGEDGQTSDISMGSPIISPVKLNVLYAHYPNELQIALPGIPAEELIISISNGLISRLRDGYWLAVPDTAGQEAILTMTRGPDKPVLFRSVFRVLPLPVPEAFIEWEDKNGEIRPLTGTNVRKEEFSRWQQLATHYPDGLLELDFKIKSYSFVWEDSFGNMIREESENAVFTEQQRTQLQRIGRGKKLFLSDIKAVSSNGVEFRVPSLEFSVY